MSESNIKYNFKGEAQTIRSKLDESKKRDLRQNHFDIGGPSCSFKVPTATLAYRPGTAKERVDARPTLNAGQARDLRSSHWQVGQASTPSLSDAARGCRNSTSVKTMPHLSTNVASGPHNVKRPDTAFVTSSMMNFKWVQPFPNK